VKTETNLAVLRAVLLATLEAKEQSGSINALSAYTAIDDVFLTWSDDKAEQYMKDWDWHPEQPQ
jgi:hypothetical protein